MHTFESLSRRSFLAAAAVPAALNAKPRHIPVGLEMYSVRHQEQQDEMGTVRSVAGVGYQDVEFFAPYFEWKADYAKEVRKLLDDLGIHCWSTHNSSANFSGDNLAHAIELNHILGSRYIVMASAGRITTLDGWKAVAATLNEAAEKLKPEGIQPGYHNHQLEFTPLDGKRPMEILAAETGKDVLLQLDVGTCIQAGSDPVAWINANPGRIRVMHCKDWSRDPAVGYKALFGEGVAPWKQIFAAAEKTGGIEYYLIEQEGSRYPELETVKLCLANFRKIHGRA